MSARGAIVALLLVVALPLDAAAQSGYDVPAPPSDYGTPPTSDAPVRFDAPPELEVAPVSWPEPATSLGDGIRFPVRGTQPDEGVVVNGIGFFIGAYVSALLLTTPFANSGRGDTGFILFGFVPFAQWAVGFYDTGCCANSIFIFINGAVWSVMQVVGAFILLGGLLHERDLIRERPEAGDVSLTPNGVEVAF